MSDQLNYDNKQKKKLILPLITSVLSERTLNYCDIFKRGCEKNHDSRSRYVICIVNLRGKRDACA